jgi:hypothetical protein
VTVWRIACGRRLFGRPVKVLIHNTFFKTKCIIRRLKKYFIDKYIYIHCGLYCIIFTAVLTSNCQLFFRGKGIFHEKTSIPANTGIDIFEIPVLYRPRYCLFNTELETLAGAAFLLVARKKTDSMTRQGRSFLHQLSSHLESHLNCYFFWHLMSNFLNVICRFLGVFKQ